MNNTKKELGQHWLTDRDSLLAMVGAADIVEGDHVLEIGPGLGYLTDKLVVAKAKIIALEFDQDLISKLQKKYDYTNLVTVVEGDVRTYDMTTLPEGYKICANIPYYLTANLLRRLTDEHDKPSVAALLVQKEVAQKVAAPEGKRSMLATLVQASYVATLDMLVPAVLFDPAPKVDSQVLVLSRKETPLVATEQWGPLVGLVKMAYASPRKKLRANLAAGLKIEKQEADKYLEQAGIDVGARAEALTDKEWLALLSLDLV